MLAFAHRKFGKQMQKRQLDLPEYAARFLNYKALKKLIKQLSATPTIAARSASAGAQGHVDPQIALRANKEVFFFRLEREIENVNVFYVQREAEFSLRLKTLLEKRRTIQARNASTSKISASFATLVEGFQQFDNDLNKLQQFVEVNETAISKILKKWDKTAKSRTKELYLQRAVEIQPCFNREVLRDLSDRATTSRLDLEAWAEGENVQIDIDRPAGKVIGQRVGTDESDVDLQILQAVATGNLASLREWIMRLQKSPQASDRFTRIFLASINDSSDEALGLLLETNFVDLHAEDDINERNCLHEAAIYGRDYVLYQGLTRGVDVSRADAYGRIPLHYACLKGRVGMVKTLIEANDQTVDYKDHDDFTPLIHSIIRHQLACVQELLSNHARIDPLTDADHIPLNLACQHESVQIASLLLQQGARLLPDAEGLYPQHLVARSSQSPEFLLLLKEHGADLNQKDKLYQWTPLFHAASEGRIECLRTLLQNSVDVNALDEKGLSAMYYATWEGHLECMEQLWLQNHRSQIPSDSLREGPLHIQGSQMSRLINAEPSQTAQEGDGIPDLSLPPPIIPLRRYGHNFLDTKTLISISFSPGSEAIAFFNEGRYPAARITLSSKLSDLIPRNIMLPIQEDSRNVWFQIDGLDTFTIDFEVFPTFGSKVIAKSVALPDVFRATESSSASCCLPLFDPRLRAIGQIRFSFQVIKPYCGDPLDIAHFATYWKATSALDDRSGLVTGSSLSGDYLRLYVQLTRDCVPILYPKYKLSHHGLEISIGHLTYDEIQTAGSGDTAENDVLAEINSRGFVPSVDELQKLINSMTSLQDLLANLKPDIRLNLQVLYPTALEERSLGLGPVTDINTFADAVLNNVFDHARSSKQQSPDCTSPIVFTSNNANICTALHWKQPNYPVLLCNDLLEPRMTRSTTGFETSSFSQRHSSISIKESARMAQSNNFMGLMIQSRVQEMVPALVDTIKELGLVLVVDKSNEKTEPDSRASRGLSPIPEGVNGVMMDDGILTFHDTVDM